MRAQAWLRDAHAVDRRAVVVITGCFPEMFVMSQFCTAHYVSGMIERRAISQSLI
jgi:hypothetical protein